MILEVVPPKPERRGKLDKEEKGKGKEEKLKTGSLVSGIVKEAHQLFVVLQISEGERHGIALLKFRAH